MKTIPLSGEHGKGKIALVDDEDFEIVSLFRWHANKAGNLLYAKTGIHEGKGITGGYNVTILSLHRLIMNAKKGEEIDHINHNTLDNRKTNLRICTKRQNLRNSHSRKGSSKYKGVYWHKGSQKWSVAITLNYKPKHIGYFHEEVAAAQAYDIVARELHGEFACFNNI